MLELGQLLSGDLRWSVADAAPISDRHRHPQRFSFSGSIALGVARSWRTSAYSKVTATIRTWPGQPGPGGRA